MKKNVLIFVMNRWESTAGGIQTVNRELASAVARQFSELKCYALVTKATQSEIDAAKNNGVRIIAGHTEDDWVNAMLAPGLKKIKESGVLAIIGHGQITGDQAANLRRAWYSHAILIHFVHTVPLDTEVWKEYKQDSHVSEANAKHTREIELASKADLVACVGPRIYRTIFGSLIARRVRAHVVQITCGVSDREPAPVPQNPRILFVGRTDSVIAKGLDIAAYAIGHLTRIWRENPATAGRPMPQLKVRGAQGDKEALYQQLILLAEKVCLGAKIIIAPYTQDQRDLDAEFREASVVLLPSRAEGYGLVACEAISLEVPVVLSLESGIAEEVRLLSKDTELDTNRMLIDMSGKPEDLGLKFAKAMMRILANEKESRAQAKLLKRIVLPSLSWDAGAKELISRVYAFHSERRWQIVSMTLKQFGKIAAILLVFLGVYFLCRLYSTDAMLFREEEWGWDGDLRDWHPGAHWEKTSVGEKKISALAITGPAWQLGWPTAFEHNELRDFLLRFDIIFPDENQTEGTKLVWMVRAQGLRGNDTAISNGLTDVNSVRGYQFSLKLNGSDLFLEGTAWSTHGPQALQRSSQSGLHCCASKTWYRVEVRAYGEHLDTCITTIPQTDLRTGRPMDMKASLPTTNLKNQRPTKTDAGRQILFDFKDPYQRFKSGSVGFAAGDGTNHVIVSQILIVNLAPEYYEERHKRPKDTIQPYYAKEFKCP